MSNLAVRGVDVSADRLQDFSARYGLPIKADSADGPWLDVVARVQNAEALAAVRHPCLGIVELVGEPSPTWTDQFKGDVALLVSMTTASAFTIDLAQACLSALSGAGLLAEDALEALRLPIHEAVANGLIHGNLDLDSAGRENLDDFETYSRILTERLSDAVYANRHLELAVSLVGDEVSVTVRDQGRGYDVSAAPTGQKSGRGLMIIRGMAKSVDVAEDGRCITMRFAR